MSWSSLAPTTILGTAILGTAILGAVLGCHAQPAAAQEPASWQLGQAGNVTFADLPIADGGRFTLFCRMLSTGPLGGLGLSAPTFRTQIINRETYSLTIVVDGIRDSFHMVARDIDLWFEAKDLNQQTQLARLRDSLIAAQRIEFGIATIGWRDSYVVTNSADIDGLMDSCL